MQLHANGLLYEPPNPETQEAMELGCAGCTMGEAEGEDDTPEAYVIRGCPVHDPGPESGLYVPCEEEGGCGVMVLATGSRACRQCTHDYVVSTIADWD
jgi:hypothetical protein